MTSTTPFPLPWQSHTTIAADAAVLATRPLRPEADQAATARFDDDVWELTPALHLRHHRRLILSFTILPERFRQVAKELFYALLVGPPPAGEPKLHILTIRLYFHGVKQFLWWLDQQRIPTLAAVGAEDLEGYQRYLLGRRISQSQRLGLRRPLRLLWSYRAVLATDRLTFDPARLDWWASAARHGSENATERIPEAVLGPLLGWALRWVDDFADDIVRASAEWAVLHANTATSRRRRGAPPAHSVHDQLAELLADYRAEQRSLPKNTCGYHRPGTRTGGVNYAHLARELDCNPATLRWAPLARLIEAAARDLGVADDTYLRAPVRGQLGGRPWQPAIRYQELPRLARLLGTACYVLIAYLSGMRDSEVKHLRRGCLDVLCDNTGRPYRRRVTGQAFKGEGSPTGVAATWIVGAPVEQAIHVLERLQPPDQDLLFALLPSSHGYARAPTGHATTTAQTNEDLAAFIGWVNASCDAHRLPDRIPLVGGRPWRLRTSQFRRTLAWFIARHPGGVIAGAIAYRHQRVQMFEGYAGTSASGFRAEVEAEQALERGERLLAMVEGHEHQRLAGPAAAEAETRLAEFGRRVGFAGTVVTDPRRLKLIMRRHDPNVFPGEFVTCVFNPDKALCLRAGTPTSQGPALADCKPMACRNVALTGDNLPAWQQHLAHLDMALGNDTLAPYLRHRLQQQRDDVARFLESTGGGA